MCRTQEGHRAASRSVRAGWCVGRLQGAAGQSHQPWQCLDGQGPGDLSFMSMLPQRTSIMRPTSISCDFASRCLSGNCDGAQVERQVPIADAYATWTTYSPTEPMLQREPELPGLPQHQPGTCVHAVSSDPQKPPVVLVVCRCFTVAPGCAPKIAAVCMHRRGTPSSFGTS